MSSKLNWTYVRKEYPFTYPLAKDFSDKNPEYFGDELACRFLTHMGMSWNNEIWITAWKELETKLSNDQKKKNEQLNLFIE